MFDFNDYRFFDIHYHASPDLYERRFDALKAGEYYQSLNGAVILKSHLGATSVQASLAQAKGLPVFPSVVLNHIAGGINYQVVIRALAEYKSDVPVKMLVHFPTITGRQYKSRLSRQAVYPDMSSSTMLPETLFNEHFKLKPQVIDILKMSADFPVVISTGHASKEEVYALIEASARYKVTALLLNQPANPLTGLNAAALCEIAKNPFVWIEQTFLTYSLGHQSHADFADVLLNVPRVIYSSDLGQTSQMEIKDWFNYSQRLFQTLEIPPARQHELFKANAIRLLQY